jgi:hypothetical protein
MFTQVVGERTSRRVVMPERQEAGSSGGGRDQGSPSAGKRTDRPARYTREARDAQRAVGAQGVLIQVCLTCGKEYSYETEPPPADLCCEKCGQQVFRSFFEVTEADQAEEDFRSTTERDLAPDDAESDVLSGDILDLNNP